MATSLQEALTARQEAAKSLMPSGKQPVNTRLYSRLEYQAKKKFPDHPSTASLTWLDTKYKERGGTYEGEQR